MGTQDHPALRVTPLGYSQHPGDSLADLWNTRVTQDAEAPQQSELALEPGATIGHYELIRELGRGGMGTVQLARDLTLGRRVAIKFLLPCSTLAHNRFLVEARATAQCTHENIVVIHEVSEHDGLPYMVLEHLSGQPLSALLAQAPIPPSRAVELMVPVVRALVCAHAQGIVHRDLKPDNIFVTDTGAIKVLDFGVAKLLAGGMPSPAEQTAAKLAIRSQLPDPQAHSFRLSNLTEAGSLVGTLPYMSPEQFGAGTVDHRSDIWAVGVVLFTMVTGGHPIEPLTLPRLASIALPDAAMPRVHERAPHVPPDLAAIIDRCLRKDKDERMPTAQALLQALEPFLGSRHGPAAEVLECPYPGLAAFQEADAYRFFGRMRDIAMVLARLRDQPLVCLVGPSGAGKSSFVRAGVISALKSLGQRWDALILRPGRNPLNALAGQLAPLLLDDAATTQETMAAHTEVLARLHSEPGYLGALLRSRARARKAYTLVFVDQLEELFTLADEHERAAFLRCLAGAADDAGAPLRVVVTMRSDFIDRLAAGDELLDELGRGLCVLPPPARAGLQEALERPAELAGYRFESPDMVADMLAALERTTGALPLLQFTAGLLWDARDRQRRLFTRASYDRLGGVAGALAGHADAVLAALPAQSQALARVVFRRLVTAERTRDIVTLRELSTLAAEPQAVAGVVGYFADARLLVLRDGADGAEVELVHESLIERWPTLRRWLDEDRELARFLAELRPAARQWRARDRSPGLLWRGDAADEARRRYPACKDELTEDERGYVDAVLAHAERAARMRRRAIAGIMAFLVLLVAAAAVALLWIRAAEHSARNEAQRARQAEALAHEQARALEDSERRIRRQLDELTAAQAAQDVAEEQAELAGNVAAEAQARAQRAGDLAMLTRQELEQAVRQARQERERAQRESLRAVLQAQEAERLRAQAQAATAKLKQTLADKERLIREREQRIQTLDKESGKIITGPLAR